MEGKGSGPKGISKEKLELFRETLEDIRRESELSIADFSRKTGVSRQSYNLYKRLENTPSTKTIKRIADFSAKAKDILLERGFINPLSPRFKEKKAGKNPSRGAPYPDPTLLYGNRENASVEGYRLKEFKGSGRFVTFGLRSLLMSEKYKESAIHFMSNYSPKDIYLLPHYGELNRSLLGEDEKYSLMWGRLREEGRGKFRKGIRGPFNFSKVFSDHPLVVAGTWIDALKAVHSAPKYSVDVENVYFVHLGKFCGEFLRDEYKAILEKHGKSKGKSLLDYVDYKKDDFYVAKHLLLNRQYEGVDLIGVQDEGHSFHEMLEFREFRDFNGMYVPHYSRLGLKYGDMFNVSKNSYKVKRLLESIAKTIDEHKSFT